MKSTDERVQAALGRAKAREAAARRRRQRAVAFGGSVLGVVVVVAVGVGMPSLSGTSTPSAGAALGLMGSVLADGPAIGYVVMGLLGLVVGAAMTALAFKLGHRPDSASVPEAKAIEGGAASGKGRTP